MSVQDLRANDMMSHLLDSLEDNQDIGHYGRLVFAMIGRHFMNEDELLGYLMRNPGFDETQARALLRQVEARGYNPPKREKILEWQQEQGFPICPTDDPDACNVYKNLRFPDEVYQKVNEYYEQKATT